MKKRYEGQALAIVMIVIVIASILGVAMFSRTVKDTKRLASEKSSAEALEIADSLIGAINGVSTSSIEAVCASNSKYGAGLRSVDGCKASGKTDVESFLAALGINTSLSAFDKCDNAASTVQITAKLATKDDEYEIAADDVRSFIIGGQAPNPVGCTLQVYLQPRGDNIAGVSITRIYGRNYVNGVPTEYKAYDYTDSVQYCIYNSGQVCSSSTRLLGTWTPVLSGSALSIPLTAVGGYSLQEIRVRTLGTSVAIRSELSNANCVAGTEMIKLTTSADCSGASRGKEIQFPQNEWSLSLFDYVLFNGKGALGLQ